jgi:hypothetical protein
MECLKNISILTKNASPGTGGPWLPAVGWEQAQDGFDNISGERNAHKKSASLFAAGNRHLPGLFEWLRDQQGSAIRTEIFLCCACRPSIRN